MQKRRKHQHILMKIKSGLIAAFLFCPLLAFANTTSCHDLTGVWQGTYTEDTHRYGQSGPWPVTFTIQYNPKTHLFVGLADTPFVPSAVTEEGQVTFVSKAPAQIIGMCREGEFQQIALRLPEHQCGRYETPGGKWITPRALMLQFPYEFSMSDALFTLLVHKVNDQAPPALMPPDDLPDIETCH